MATTWLTTDEVTARLRCSWDTVRARMSATTTTTCWLNVGTARKPTWHFDADTLDAWWIEACRLWTETPEQRSCASDGATSKGSTPAPSPRGPQAKRSRARLPTTRPSVSRGGLVSLATSLASRTP